MKFVSLFAGPGGMCMGAKELGIETIGIEWDANACKTRRAAGLATIEGDVRAYGPKDFSECEGLMGGPPCQTFTVAGKGAGRKALDEVLSLVQWMDEGEDVSEVLSGLDDVRTALVLEPLRWALEAMEGGSPYRVIVLEQVPAVLPVWNAYAEVLRKRGYSVSTGLLNAEEHGVPQTRKRAFLSASLDREARLPRPTHRRYVKDVPQSEGPSYLLPWVSIGDVVPRDAPYWVRSNYNTASTGQRGRRTSEQPAFTVTGCVMRNRFFGWDGTELDRVDYAEAGTLQSFPRDYPWSGKYIHQQIGNAAPPKLIAAVLEAALGL